MGEIKVWKLCRRVWDKGPDTDEPRELLVSAVTYVGFASRRERRDEVVSLVYEIGQTTRPLIPSAIFAFDSVLAARKYWWWLVNTSYGHAVDSFAILESTAVPWRRGSPGSILCTDPITSSIEALTKFWQPAGWTLFSSNSLAPVPDGTILCEWIRPDQEVSLIPEKKGS